MFDIGFPELVVVSIIALLVLGPERLPDALRTMGLWLGRLRRSFTAVKTEIEKEIGMDDIRRQLHNEAIMEEMQRIEAEVKTSMDTDPAADTEENSIAPPSGHASVDAPTSDDAADFANEPISDAPAAAATNPADDGDSDQLDPPIEPKQRPISNIDRADNA